LSPAPFPRRCLNWRPAAKILVTTLLFLNRYPKPAIEALYRRRWSVELDLGE
jgi:hypothetical protein